MTDAQLVIFTDLDGTLLDHTTYSFDEATDALRAVARAGVPLVLCSSKTRAEIEALQRDLGVRHPFISENGGALFVPDGYFPFDLAIGRRQAGYEVIEFGRRYADVVIALRRAAMTERVAIAAFHSMSTDDIARECGLTAPRARLAKQREYDEPFRVLNGTPAARLRLLSALRRAGFRCTRGARFDHVMGATDKGVAVTRLRQLYEHRSGAVVVTAGLGDSFNDLPMLSAVDIPIIVRNDAVAAARLLKKLPTGRVTDGQGPAAWSQAVRDIVRAVAPVGCWVAQ